MIFAGAAPGTETAREAIELTVDSALLQIHLLVRSLAPDFQ